MTVNILNYPMSRVCNSYIVTDSMFQVHVQM